MGISFESSHLWVWAIRAYTFDGFLAEPLEHISKSDSFAPFLLLMGLRVKRKQPKTYGKRKPNPSQEGEE